MTRHRFDVFSFLAGAIAVATGILVLVDGVSISITDLRVGGPVLVLALGLALLVGGGRDRTVEDRAVTTTAAAERVEVAEPTDATESVDDTEPVDDTGPADTAEGWEPDSSASDPTPDDDPTR